MQRIARLLPTAAATLALCAAPTSAQDVRVLDKTNGPYTTLAEALAAADDGDVIRVAPGTYGGSHVIENRSLTIAAEEKATFRHVTVRGLTPDQVVVFRGITFRRNNSTTVAGATNVTVSEHDGIVLFEDCRFRTNVLVAGPGATLPAVDLRALADGPGAVLFTRCAIDGGGGGEILAGAVPPMLPSEAVVAEEGRIALFDCTVAGGSSSAVADGATAVRLEESELYAVGGTIAGGDGGEGGLASCDGGDGGDALSGTGSAVLTAAVAQGGAGGAADVGCTAGSPGDAQSLSGGYQDLGGVATSVELSPALAEGGSVATLDAVGPAPPGGAAWVLRAGLVPNLTPLVAGGGLSGVSVLDSAFQVGGPMFLLGGAAQLLFPVQPGLSPGQEAIVVHVQGMFLDPGSATLSFGAPSVVVAVAAGFDPL